MTLKINKQLLGLLILTFSILIFSGCSKTLDTESNIMGEWTYTNGLAEIEFDKDGNAAVITPSGETTATTQYSYKIEDNKITLISKETGKTDMTADIEITEKDNTEYLTLSNVKDGEGEAINPSTLEFKKLGDSTEAIDVSSATE